MLQRWMGKKVDTGVIYHYDELDTEWKDNNLELGNAKAEAAYKFGGKHTPLTHLLRGILWRKRFWCTEKLNNWLDDFKPECVFLAFSDDYFIPADCNVCRQRDITCQLSPALAMTTISMWKRR